MQSLSLIPSISTLLENYRLEKYISEISLPIVSSQVKQSVMEYKALKVQSQKPIISKEEALEEILNLVCQTLNAKLSTKTRPVINATGIALHTNLGRSPLIGEVWDKIKPLNTQYSSLELDMNTGKRGKRKSLIPELLIEYLQAPKNTTDVLVVNNNAAAVLLLLASFPKGKEVIISRGELVQIGGGFRIPEILEQSGLILKEVGTTNITTLDDYKNAINENTVMILKVHTSNFAVQGFTKSVSTQNLAQICSPSVILAVDQGSGLLKEDRFGEVSVASHLKQGADIVLFSGDKILGGTQAGLAVGKKEIITSMEKNPLMRAFRTGKMVSSYLEEYLKQLSSQNAKGVALQMMEKSESEIQALAQKLQDQFDPLVKVIKTQKTLGGGSTPDFSLPSYGVQINSQDSAETTLKFLRDYTPAILGYIHEDKAILDLSTLLEGDFSIIAQALQYYQTQQTQPIQNSIGD